MSAVKMTLSNVTLTDDFFFPTLTLYIYYIIYRKTKFTSLKPFTLQTRIYIKTELTNRRSGETSYGIESANNLQINLNINK